MSDGLRDALEKLATVLWSDAANNGTDIRHPRVVLENRARDVERILAAHPVEPATERTDEAARMVDQINALATGAITPPNPREAEALALALPGRDPEPAGVSDEAVEAARLAYSEACRDGRHLDAAGRFRAALEAAQPFIQPQVVASRERVEQVVREICLFRDVISGTDAVLNLLGGAK